GVEIHRARAHVVDPHTVEVGGRKVTAKHILVATGSWPVLPALPGIEHAISSNEAFELERLPKRAITVGGGYIALEFASIFHGLGVKTALTYRGKRLLRGFDAELGTRIAEERAAKGLDICLGCEPAAIRKRKDGALEIEFTDGTIRETDLVLFATGRRPNSAQLGLESAGVKLAADGAVIVDKYSSTNINSIHAVGDVTNRIKPTPVDHENVATAVFANPNLATVGLSEEKARERYGAVEIYKASFRGLKLTMTDKRERTFMKLV